MSKKKVTAPLSYDPGKGRPKEYLAYLNWQEMQELMRINGNNVELGPRGLPSFPPDDAIGSGQTPGTGNWTGSPGGTTSSGTSTTGSQNYGTDSSSWSGSGGGSGGTSTSSSASSAASSSASSNTADTQAQQEAAERDAANAARSSAFAEDARKAGIGSINVGPMQSPVKIGGGQIFGSLSRLASDSYGMSAPDVAASQTVAVAAPIPRANPLNDPTKFIQQEKEVFSGVNPVALSRIVRLQEEFGSPLTITSGVRPPGENALRGGAQRSQHIHGNAIDIAIPGASAADTARLINAASGVGFTGIGAYRPGKVHVDVGPTRVWGPNPPSLSSIPKLPGEMQRALRSHVAGTTPKINIDYASLERQPTQVVTPSIEQDQQEEAVNYAGSLMDPVARAALSGIANLPGTLSNFSIPSIPEASQAQKNAISMARAIMPESAFQSMVNKAVADATSGFSAADAFTSGLGAFKQAMGPPQTSVAENEIQNVEEQYRKPVGVSASVIPSKYNYPVKPDGTPYTSEDIANLPPDIQKAHYEALMAERMGRVPYNLTEAQRTKIAVAKGVGRVVNYNPLTRAFVTGSRVLGGGLGMLPGAAGEFGEGLADAAGQIRDPGAAVEAYETASPLQQVQMEVLAGKPNRIPGTKPVYTGTTYAGGAPIQEPGSKGNEFRQSASYQSPYTAQPSGPATMAAEDGRPSQFYLWDLGIGIPSPGDPDYNDYQKYLRGRRSSTTV